MSRIYKKRKKAQYIIVAEWILEGAPFDISVNGGGFTKIQELVAVYSLKDYCEADRYKLWAIRLRQVEKAFDQAIVYINDNPYDLSELEGVHVFKHKPEAKRNNQVLSLKGSYRKSKKRNTDRLIRRVESVCRTAVAEIKKTEPERLIECRDKTKKLLAGS